MKHYCLDLNLNIPLFRYDDFVLPKIRHTKHTSDILSKSIIDFFSEKNLNISLVEIFYSPSKFKSKIHIDGISGDYTKINFIFGGKNGIMSWYSTNNDHENNRDSSMNTIGTFHTIFSESEVKLEYQKNISLSLIQVGVPHRVENFQGERWAVCLVYRDKKTMKRPTMTESIEIFKNNIENVDE